MDAIPLDLRSICRRGFNALLLASPLVLVLLLIARRLAGALVEPLPLFGWLFVGLLLALWLAWFRPWLAGQITRATFARTRIAIWLAPAVAIFAALLLWLPGTGGLPLIGFIALVAVGGSSPSVLTRPLIDRVRPRGTSASRPTRDSSPLAPLPAEPEEELSGDELFDGEFSEEGLSEEESADGLGLAPSVMQQFIRRREPGQAESIEGSFRVHFSAGQRTASAHVAICPPFNLPPRCQAAVASGPSAEIRVATALPFGIRFEIKLARTASEPLDVVIELAIESADATKKI